MNKVLCSLVLTFCVGTVCGQEKQDSVNAARRLPEVFVMAEKRSVNLQKLPYSVSALNGRDAFNYRLWNLNQLTSIVPNLYSSDPGDGRNVTSIRGVVSSSYDPAVVTYIDGVSQFTLDTYIPQVMNVSAIEILRGPQGTLYGRNAMGGVINVITTQPDNRTSLSGELSFSKYSDHLNEMKDPNETRLRAVVNLKTPLINDRLFAGASFLYESSDGYYFNDLDSTKFDRQHQFGGNYFLKYVVNSRWSVILNAKHMINRNHGAFPLQIGIPQSKPFIVTQNAKSQLIDNVFNSSLSANYTGANFNFNSQLSYQSNYRYYDQPIDGDFSPIDGITIINNYGKDWNNVKVLTEEFRFTSPVKSSSKWQWIAGGYFFLQDVPNKQAVHFGEDAQYVGSPDKNYEVINSTKGKNNGLAIFGKTSYSVTPKTEIALGIRFDYQHLKQSVLGEYKPDASPDPIFNTQDDTTATASYNAFSPTVSVMHHVKENWNLYAVYSRGFRTGGFTQLSLDPSQPPLYLYKPEYSNNFEIGSKFDLLNAKLRFNAAIFLTSINNAQVPTLILPDAITVTKNTGKMESKGFELELKALPAKGMELAYNFGYTNAKFKKLKLPVNGNEIDLKGNRQIFTPQYTSMLAVQQTISLSERNSFSLITRGEWMLIGKQYFDLANAFYQSPYDLINLKLGLQYKHVSVTLWGRNLLNKKYISYGYDFGGMHFAEPRIFGITLGFFN